MSGSRTLVIVSGDAHGTVDVEPLGSTRRTVLVTGAAGFPGSHLVDSLLGGSFEVVGLDNLMTGSLESAGRDRHFHMEIGDVRERLKVYAEVIFNLACPASPRALPIGPTRDADDDRDRRDAPRRARPAAALSHRAREHLEVYGDPLEHPRNESYWGHVNPIGERACYDEGKRAAETVLMDAIRMHRGDARIIRIFNTYVPRMAFNDGRVVSNFLMQAIGDNADHELRKRPAIALFLLRLGPRRRILPGGRGARVRLSDEPREPSRVHDARAAEAVMKVTDKRVDLVKKPLPADDPRRRCPDISKAKRLIDFNPRIELEEGLRLTRDNFEERLRLST